MKKEMIAGLVGLAFAFSAQAATVYEDAFDNDGLASNTGKGGGLSVTASANGASWGDSGNLDFSPDNGDNNERATVSSLNSSDLSGGFELTVTYSVSDIMTDTAGNRFSFGLISQPPTFNVDPFALTTGTRPAGFTSFGLNVTAEDSLQGLTLNTGTVALVAGQSGFTSSTTEVNTLTLSVDDIGDYDLMFNGSPVGSGASGLNLSNAFYFAAFSQDDLARPSISSVSLSRLLDGNLQPLANDQDLTSFPDTPVEITLTGIDYDGSNLTYSVDDSMLAGSLAGATNVWIYTPTNGSFQGVDHFTFTVNDGETNSAPATVTITVTNQLPIADAQSAVVFANTNVNITLTGSDPDNGPSNLTYSVASMPVNGTLTGMAPDLTYTPTNDYIGADSFTFTVNDGLDDSDPSTVSITIQAPSTIFANYTFDEVGAVVNLESVDTEPGSTNSTFASGAGFNLVQTFGAIIGATGGSGVSAGKGEDLAGAITANDYFTFTVDVVGDATLDLTSLAFDYGRWVNGTKDFYLFSSVDGFTVGDQLLKVNNAAQSSATSKADSGTATFNFTGAAYAGLTNVEFRIYVDDRAGTSNAGSGVMLDNVIVRGAMNSAGAPVMAAFVSDGSMVLAWDGGGSYNVLTNANLVTPNWGVVESGTSSPVTNAIGIEPQLFYKLSN